VRRDWCRAWCRSGRTLPTSSSARGAPDGASYSLWPRSRCLSRADHNSWASTS
jgi:hypothetical protein